MPFVRQKERPRFSVGKMGRAHAYTPKGTADAERMIREAYMGECVRMFGHVVTAPERAKVMLAATFRTAAPKSRPRWVTRWLWDSGLVPFVTKPDVDNLLKLVQDALNPYKDKDGDVVLVAWRDDSQVVETHAYKLDRERDGRDVTTVTVFWEEEDEG